MTAARSVCRCRVQGLISLRPQSVYVRGRMKRPRALHIYDGCPRLELDLARRSAAAGRLRPHDCYNLVIDLLPILRYGSSLAIAMHNCVLNTSPSVRIALIAVLCGNYLLHESIVHLYSYRQCSASGKIISSMISFRHFLAGPAY